MNLAWLVRVVFLLCALHSALGQTGVLLGRFTTREHGVAGTLYAIDARTLEVRGFEYDGRGPAAVFWVGEGETVNAAGTVAPALPDCNVERIPAADGDTVRFELPAGTSLADIGYVSVWCEEFDANFGEVLVDASTVEGVAEADGEAECGAKAQTFPVEEGFNCEELTEQFQVRWRRVSDNDLEFQLVGRVPQDWYMGFGPSGRTDRTFMVGSDVVIARETATGVAATDYFMNGRAQCARGVGVCPDTVSTDGPGSDDVREVTGERNLDLLMVRFKRSIAAQDTSTDLAYSMEAGAETFVVWATGPFNAEIDRPQIHPNRRETMTVPAPGENFAFEFGRAPVNNCPTGLFAQEPVIEVELKPWTRPSIMDATNITARIGPSGDARGVKGITQGSSWGVAWYMSKTGTTGEDVLIPAIAVERGKTYNFKVYGGDDPSNGAQYHPLYITSDPDGGFQSKSPQQRKEETIYAGIEDIETDAGGGVTSFTPTAIGKICQFSERNRVNLTTTESFAEYFDQLDTSCAEDDAITNASGLLTFTVPEDAPDLLYYQCVTHTDLGFKLVVFDEGQVDETRLKAESGGGARDSSNSNCSPVTYQGQQVAFAQCLDLIEGGAYQVYWTLGEDSIDTLISAELNEGWAGFGWGRTVMVGSDAVIAYVNSAGEAVVDDYFLGGKTSPDVQPERRQKLTNISAEFQNGRLQARFTRPLTGDNIASLTDDETSAIWAIGPAVSSRTNIPPHQSAQSGDVRNINLASGGGLSSATRFSTALRAHGVMMGLSWIFIVPVAVIVMRFFKKANPLTFYVHRGFNALAVLIAVIAYIIALAEGSHSRKGHLGVGSVVLILSILQVIGGTFRPAKDKSSRKVWFPVHANAGRVALLLAFINVYIGLDIYGVRWYWFFIVTLGIVAFIGMNAAFSAMPRRFPVIEVRDVDA